MRLSHLPLRLTTGAFILNSGLSKRGLPDEAAAGIEATLAMFADVLRRDSHDDAGAPVSLTVHYGTAYNNAF